MNIAASIKSKINKLDSGEVFTYDTLGIPPNEFLAAAKALSRLVEDDVIRRYKNGVYYKPKQTAFGE